jgi:hypothetical protein
MTQRKHPNEPIDDEKSDVLAKSIPDCASAPLSTDPGPAHKYKPMTRMRRISISVEHTEVTISVTETSAQSGLTSSVTANVCPDCGARWIPNFQDAVRSLGLTATQLKAAASEGRLHLFCSPQNEIWICERSIQQMRKNS